MIHGVTPGPLMMQKNPEIFWSVVASMYIGNGMLLVLNLPLIRMWVQVLKNSLLSAFSLDFILLHDR